jgi:hypothetical protein
MVRIGQRDDPTRPLLGGIGLLLALAAALAIAFPAIGATASETPKPTPSATERPVPLDKPSRPVRVRVPYAGIDLPVISSERNMPGNPRGYPLCDVAQYWTKYDMPGEPGTAWILAHAQPGMFLPLYTINVESDGKGLIGRLIKLQLRDRRLLTYRITEVRVSNDETIARRPNRRQHRLILQTSTGFGSDPKLQVAARLIDAEWTDEPRPDPQPRACWQPTPRPTRKPPRNGATPTPTPEPVEIAETDQPLDAMTLVLGSGAVLLGATIVAVYLVRRP